MFLYPAFRCSQFQCIGNLRIVFWIIVNFVFLSVFLDFVNTFIQIFIKLNTTSTNISQSRNLYSRTSMQNIPSVSGVIFSTLNNKTNYLVEF